MSVLNNLAALYRIKWPCTGKENDIGRTATRLNRKEI